jgi:hypothetical protein
VTQEVPLHCRSAKTQSPEAEVVKRGTEGEHFNFDSDKTNKLSLLGITTKVRDNYSDGHVIGFHN